MGFSNIWVTLRTRGRERFDHTDVFPQSEAFSEFEESAQFRGSGLQAARMLGRRLGRPYKRLVPVLLCTLYLLCMLVFHALGMASLSTVLVTAGLIAACVALFLAIFRAGLHERFRDRQLRLPIVVAAAACLLLVFYLDPATQIALAPFLFVAMAYGLLTLSRRAALLVCAGILAGYALVVVLHHVQLRNPALLRLEVLHFVALALALPAYVLLMGRVRLLHRLLQKTSSEMRSIAESARRDALAGCLNRRSILAALEEQKQLADESGIPLCLAVVDLDHFKRINDELGHLGGDEVLRTFAQLAQQVVRTDDFFGRYGGEEFLLVFPATPLLPALNSCERIRAQVESHPWEGPLRGRVTVSIGVTQYMLGESVLEFFSRADTAMYMAKQGGRNQVVVQEPVGPHGPSRGGEPQAPAHGYF
ncbi:sensor domain-containing diguanylate cyclase [Paracidovorax anthurii]|uniref:diguanylate cyclase n=1 Tax=Paracidovorax anthurii TaxID=78229 RepID=A0A328ZST2_9BURK|nr:diguanylate cyclase [Paracidovorax anthurii]RAR85927.1 diguanylate cyclase (GGDEF)-like protein [Paracidovorax anthurii]WCM92526.1 diguanylate cyclase [Acidovorax sp. NCPPB 2350]